MTGSGGPSHEDIDPNDQQESVIECDTYPQRVLAGAGTGKTYTMVEKIRTLIEEKDVPPEEILALTFTNQAAESMREKLVASIGARANDVDAYTYHAIGREILSEFGYYGSFDPRARLAGEVERLQLVYESLDDLDYDFTSPGVSPPDGRFNLTEDDLSSFITELKSEGIAPNEIRDYLPDETRLVELAALPERIESDAKEYLRAETKPTSSEELDTLIENIRTFRGCLEDHRERLGDSSAEGDIEGFLGVFVEICEALVDECRKHEQTIVDGDYQPFGRAPAYLFNGYSSSAADVERLSSTPVDRLTTFIEELRSAHDFTDGYSAYEAALDDADLMDYDDLIIEANRLLETNDAVREWATDRWSYVFCDEFQDTDSIQFDLIQQLASDAKLFVVGDDDQSIYEWRGANTENITDDFREVYPEFQDFKLEYNYRSRGPILELADNALEQLTSRETEKKLKPTEERKGTETGIAFFEEDDPVEEAVQVADAISHLRTGDGAGIPDAFDIGDVAILVRKNDHVRPIRRALNQSGIPFELVGGLVSASTGVDTITAYLKTLVDHNDEVSLNRVLTLCYRLPESDLAALNRRDGGLWETLQTCDPAAFEGSDALQRARTDLRELDREARVLSISNLYEEIKRRTRLDLFLQEDERRELRYFDELIEGFDDSPVETELSEAFIEYLRYAATSVSEGSGPGDQPEVSDEVVTIMTVHKAKGLEFPVVFVPRLEANEWAPRQGDFSQLQSAFTSDETPVSVDSVRRERDEQQRVFHVAATRAEKLLVLSGSADGSGGSKETVTAEAMEQLYPDYVEWDDTSTTFDIWSLVTESLPDSAVDWTDRAWTGGGSQAILEDDERTYGFNAANEQLLDLADRALKGDLTPLSPGEGDIGVHEAAVRERSPNIRQQFSYTALDTYQTCPRQYYLDHVVDAFDDSAIHTRTESRVPEDGQFGTSDGQSDGVSRRLVGLLFHETAEKATQRGRDDPETWYSIAGNQASYRPQADEATLEEVRACIDRYFESEVTDWELVAAERRFELEFPLRNDARTDRTYPVVGIIDAIYEDQSGDYIVVDYKTGQSDANYELQRSIYVLAANYFIGEELDYSAGRRSKADLVVDRAGILDLGPDGPRLRASSYAQDELDLFEREIVLGIETAAATTYAEFEGGDHCQFCAHRSLPCNDSG